MKLKFNFGAFLFYYQVINDLLDPTGQNLRVREDVQVISSLLRVLILSYVLFICYSQR